MSKRHFIVSIKTIDDMLLFPTDFNGEVFLLGARGLDMESIPTLSFGADGKLLN